MINTQVLLSNSSFNLNLAFLIPILITIGLAIWNVYQQIRIETLKKEHEKQLHIHRLQFEKEFEIYNELWGKLIKLRNTAALLRPQFDYKDPNKSLDEVIKERLDNVIENGNQAVDSIEKNKPFYAEEIYKILIEIVKLTKKEIIEVQYGDKSQSEYWEDGEKTLNTLIKLTDNVCNTIRERIGNFKS